MTLDQTKARMKQVAKQFGVSERVLMEFSLSVITSMKADSVDDAYLAMTDDQRREVVEGYANVAVRKMEQFTSTYYINPEAAGAFRRTVRKLL